MGNRPPQHRVPTKPKAKLDYVGNKPDNIAAIDYGTTYCSLAYQMKEDKKPTVMQLEGENCRIPNAILLKVVKENRSCTVCKGDECNNEAHCADQYFAYERSIPAASGAFLCSVCKKSKCVSSVDCMNGYVKRCLRADSNECIVCESIRCLDEESCSHEYLKTQRNEKPWFKLTRLQVKVDSIGQLAQNSHQKLAKRKYPSHYYFERVKLALKDVIHRSVKVTAANGMELYTVEVIAITLAHLKNMLITKLKARGHVKIKATDFQWVITVPAIWKPGAKQLMREAAFLAGLCSDDEITSLTSGFSQLVIPTIKHPERVILALEPEAAALHCQALSTREDFAEYSYREEATKDTRFMVVDIGGGTVDIAAHEISQGVFSARFKSILPPSGNDFGGTVVNRAFQEYFSSLVSTHNLETFNSDSPKNAAILNWLWFAIFEEEKLQFGEIMDCESSDESEIRLRLDHKLDKELGLEINSNIKLKRGSSYISDDNLLCIKYTEVKRLFQPAVDGILQCVENALDKLSGSIDVVYLVGGFGGCKYIYSQIKTVLKKYQGEHENRSIKVIAPREHNLAVIKGAVLFGNSTHSVESRIADATYGMAVSVPYKMLEHDSAYKYKDSNGKYWSDDVLGIFVDKGESLKDDVVFVQRLTPPDPRQKSMRIQLYRSEEKGAQYIRDESGQLNVERIGCVKIELPEIKANFDRQVEITIDFSGTEIKVSGHFTNEAYTDKDINVIIDFL